MMNTISTPELDAATQIVRILTQNGYKALFAGGCVRDRLLGNSSSSDIDIATNATPSTIASLFAHVIGVGEAFGVMLVMIDGMPFEVATFRSDIGISDGRHPASVVFTDDITDAKRRDFTINGMFYDPLTDTILDYVDGQKDLAQGIIKAIGDPTLRFSEDYLRMLRAVRFATRFNFILEEKTRDAIVPLAARITSISAERIFTELTKMITGPTPNKAIELLDTTGLLPHILPEVAALKGVTQPEAYHPEGDVLVHTIIALSHIKDPTPTLAWATLLHDIGKPKTRTVTDRIRFNNHDHVGARMAQDLLLRLKAPTALIDSVVACIDNHMNFINVTNMRLSTLKRFLSRSTLPDELDLHKADCAASHGDISNYTFLVAQKEAMGPEVFSPPPLIRGADLISLGLKPGPLFGSILSEVYDLQLENELLTKDAAIRFVVQNFCQEQI